MTVFFFDELDLGHFPLQLTEKWNKAGRFVDVRFADGRCLGLDLIASKTWQKSCCQQMGMASFDFLQNVCFAIHLNT